MTQPKKNSPIASRKEINAVKAKLAGIARKRDAERQARAELKAEKKTTLKTNSKAAKGNLPIIIKRKGTK